MIIDRPTIEDFRLSQHDHSSDEKGGNIPISSIYGFEFSGALSDDQILVYGYGYGYDGWTNINSYDYFSLLGFIANPTLDGISDVTIDTIASGEILKWNGSAWINNTLSEAGIQEYAINLDRLGAIEVPDGATASFVAWSRSGTIQATTATLRTESQVRSDLGLVIGTDVQAYSADLATVAGLGTANQLLRTNAAGNAIEWFTGSSVYSVLGHTHTASEVTDFDEAVDDRLSFVVQNGTDLSWTYNDAANTFTGNVSSTLQSVTGRGATTTNATTFEGNLLSPVPTTGTNGFKAGLVGSISGDYHVVIGHAANVTTGGRSVVIGQAAASTGGNNGIAIGRSATSSGAQGVAIGYLANAGQDGYSLGYNTSSSTNAVAIGNSAIAGAFSVAIGYLSTTSTAQGAIVIGRQSSAAFNNSVAIGTSVSTTAINQIMLGSSSYEVNVSGTLKVSDGAAATPSLTFIDDTNTGFFRSGADTFNISAGGSEVGEWSSSGLSVTGDVSVSSEVFLSDGSFANPSLSFTSDSNLGIFRIGADTLGLAASQVSINSASVIGDAKLSINAQRLTADPGTTTTYLGSYTAASQAGSLAGSFGATRITYGHYLSVSDTGTTSGFESKSIYGYYSTGNVTNSYSTGIYNYYADMKASSALLVGMYGYYANMADAISSGTHYGFYFNASTQITASSTLAGFRSDISNYDGTTSAYGFYSSIGSASSGAGSTYGFWTLNQAQHQNNYGGYFNASGTNAFGSNYGVFGAASNAANNWAGYFDSGNVYIANVLLFGNDGTASAPAISRSSDTNTGIYFSGADQLSISTGGSERFRVSSTLVHSNEPITIGTATIDQELTVYDMGVGFVYLQFSIRNTNIGGIAGMEMQNDSDSYEFQVFGDDFLMYHRTDSVYVMFYEGTSDSMIIGNSATPYTNSKVTVQQSNSLMTDAASGTTLALESASTNYLSFMADSGESSYHGLVWGDSADNFVSGLWYQHSTDLMLLYVNNRMAVAIDGTLGISGSRTFKYKLGDNNPTTATGDAVVEIETLDDTGQAVLLLDQNDTDQAFIQFEGTTPATNKLVNFSTQSIASGSTRGPDYNVWTHSYMIRCEISINGGAPTTVWIPAYT